MKNETDASTDEFFKFLEASGVTLTQAEKEAIRKHEETQKLMRESLGREEVLNLCRRLGRSGRALVQKSLNAYLAKCRASAQTQRGKIDIQQIYDSRRAF